MYDEIEVNILKMDTYRGNRNEKDQDADLNEEYSTRNSVPKNPPGDDMAIVIAKGDVTGDAFFYATSDSRARSAISGWDTFDPYSETCYKEDGSALLSEESIDDTCISTTFDLGDLAPGESVSLDLINSLDPNSDEALAAINQKTVKGVNSLNDITVLNGTDENGIGLPDTIDIELSDGSTTSDAVTWDNGNPAYDGNAEGTYTFTGTLTLPDGVTNPDNYTASVNVTVQAANNETTTSSAVTVEDVNSLDDITVSNGINTSDIGLPDTIDITLSDGTTTSAAVTWNNGSPAYDGDDAGTSDLRTVKFNILENINKDIFISIIRY